MIILIKVLSDCEVNLMARADVINCKTKCRTIVKTSDVVKTTSSKTKTSFFFKTKTMYTNTKTKAKTVQSRPRQRLLRTQNR